MMAPSVEQTLILFILVGVGFAAARMGILGPEAVRGLSRFLVDFTLPALVFVSMQRPFSPELRNLAFRVLGFSTLVYALSFPLAYGVAVLYRRASPEEKGVHRFAMCFSNVGFMGFPVAEAVLGRDSLFMVSVYNIPFQVLAFSVGVVMLAGRRSAAPDGAAADGVAPSGSTTSRRPAAFLNPAVLAAVAGFACFMLSVRLPPAVFSALELLGGATTPLSMAVIGAVLAGASPGRAFGNPRLWATTAYRLAFFPLLVFALATAVGLRGMERSVPTLIAAMPVAANATILAGVHGGDTAAASVLVFVSTLLSLLTIPALSGLIA